MNVTGNLVKRGNKWSVAYRINGKQKTKALGLDVRTTTRKKAEKAMKEMLQHIQDGNLDLYEMNFIQFLDWWLEQIKPLIKDSTYEGYLKNVQGKIKPYFGQYNFKLIDLRPMHFTDYFVYLKEHGKSNGKGGLKKKSIMNIRGVLTSALDYAKTNALIAENVALQGRLPRFDDEADFEPTVYTAEQTIQLLKYASTADEIAVNLFLHIQVYTGARKGEILGLTWDSVNWDNATISIEHNRTGSKKEITNKLTTPKSRNSIRVLPIPPHVVSLLKDEKEKQDEYRQLLKDEYIEYDFDYVIRQDNGRIYNPNSINRILKRMMTALNLPLCRPHDFRHFNASVLFDSGKVAVTDITKQLGHSSTAVTEKVYVHSNRVVSDGNLKIIQSVLGDI